MNLRKQALFRRLMNQAGDDGSDTGGTDTAVEEGTAEESEGQQEGESQEGETSKEEIVVTIGDEDPPQEDEDERTAKPWVRELRKKNRESQRRIRELEEQLTAKAAPASESVAVGKKPTLEDHDYDTEKFEADLSAWYERKRKADESAARAENEQKAAKDAWQAKLDSYSKAKDDLGADDIEDAESAVQESFSITQQGIIIQGAENPALVVLALGKNSAKLAELKAIADPVKFAFAIAKLEDKLKVTKRSSAPAPEKRVSAPSGKPPSNALTGEGNRLLEEAQRTGDMTKYRQWSRQQKSKA